MTLVPSSRLQAIESLLDDPSPIVRNAVREELERLGSTGIAFLQALAKDEGNPQHGSASTLLESIAGKDPVSQFREFIDSYQYELETGSLLLARTGNAALDSAHCVRFLDQIAARCTELLVKPSNSWEQCKVLNRVLFHEYGFVGDRENYYDPENNFLNRVIDRRRGVPITLGIIYLLVADRCHIQLEPIAVPGHFMVGCFLENEPFYIDVFEGGVFREADDIHSLLRQHSIPYDDSYFLPTPVGEILCRCCRNLTASFERSGDTTRRNLYYSFVRAFEDAYRRNSQPG